MNNTFVGVHYLFQVDVLTGHMGEHSVFVEGLIVCVSLFFRLVVGEIGGNPNTTAEIAPIGDERHFLLVRGIEKPERLIDFFLILVGKKLINSNVFLSLAEVGCFAELLSLSCTSSDARYMSPLFY